MEPRLFTASRGPLTPETTYGYEVIDFARDVCGVELLEWQKFWLIHALEKNADDSFRFRRVVTVVARQNGKSYLLKVLSLWMMVRFPGSTVLGVAQIATTALESWDGAIELAENAPSLTQQATAKGAVRRANGSNRFKLGRSRYLTAAANRRAGRGLSINLLVLDELREMRTWDAWSALVPTISAQHMGIVVAITNAGDDQSVVLNSQREAALEGAEDGIAIFEWSAEEGADIADPQAWAHANPALGVKIEESDLRIALASEPPHVFRTERLNQRVTNRDEAVDLTAWGESGDESLRLKHQDDRIAVCIDVSPDMKHVSLVGAAVGSDGKVRVEVIEGWDSTDTARAELPGWIEKVQPRVVGWFPGGPAAALAADLRGIAKAQEIRASDVNACCMGLGEQVASRRVLHANQALLNNQIASAQKLPGGGGWRFFRSDKGSVDAVYAAAGAVHLARGMTSQKGKPRILVANAA